MLSDTISLILDVMNVSYEFLTRKPYIELLVELNEFKDTSDVTNLNSKDSQISDNYIQSDHALEDACTDSTRDDNSNQMPSKNKPFMMFYELSVHGNKDRRRQDYFIYAHILDQTVVDIGTISIRLDFHQPKSLFTKKLKDFVERSCFQSYDSVKLNLWITNLDGIFGFSWDFDTSQNLEVDCILGSDFLMDMNVSPVTAIKPLERVIIISGDKLIKS